MIQVAIAEDDFRVASIHERFILKIDRFKVVGKTLNAEETLQLLQDEKVDLLLLDIYMQDRLGTDLLHIIRREFPLVDVIMITAATEKELVETSLRYGVIDYIIKPVSLERFTETLENYKKRRELLTDHAEVNQQTIDKIMAISYSKDKMAKSQVMPKGIDPLTLQKVIDLMKTIDNGISAEEMGVKMGASRTTARRYLEYIVSKGDGAANLEYGIVGRPERKYRIL
ncbi:response regulator [Ferdinandcohnia quinoae]|uniref:Response regulator n=1 Tax=Fredinandcohnia quinoae TaxID=2918902 RepID=A0AAW5EAB9_9BACI|nr:response regulator [Fredinandcohnia sp. SECRCQ15]MCH1626827.1 response regulator [Fredinandcohnia sp. SECRCQ15]